MKALRTLLFVLLTASTCAVAAPASEATIKELLTITEARKLLDGMKGQIDSMMTSAIQQSLAGKPATPKQQEAITKMKDHMVALVQNELSWEKLEPMYIRLYSESFTEDEIGGMLEFYKTPSGQAVTRKLPMLMQKMMLEMRTMTSGMMPKMQSIQEEFIADMKAASK